MNKKIEFETIEAKDVELCRDLCNELMAYQKSKALVYAEAFDAMNFDTRMKKSCENAIDSHITVCRDGDGLIGYVFSTIESADEKSAAFFPPWAPWANSENSKGFYPDWLKLPQRVGCLSNIYIKDGYRGAGLGPGLLSKALEWFNGFPEIEYIFVYISNGNEGALRFYLENGFTQSHSVFNDFITAAYRKNRQP